MSREWGIYPEDCEPKQWWGARALIENRRFVLLFDRQNYEQGEKASDTDKGDMFFWMENTMDPAIQEQVKKGFFRKWEDVFRLDSESGRFHCEATTKNSGGAYLYIGVWEVPYIKECVGPLDEQLEDAEEYSELVENIFADVERFIEENKTGQYSSHGVYMGECVSLGLLVNTFDKPKRKYMSEDSLGVNLEQPAHVAQVGLAQKIFSEFEQFIETNKVEQYSVARNYLGKCVPLDSFKTAFAELKKKYVPEVTLDERLADAVDRSGSAKDNDREQDLEI